MTDISVPARLSGRWWPEINAYTIKSVNVTWDESKRRSNLAKHGLDFRDALEVLESRFRLDVPVVRNGEARILAIAYSATYLAALVTVIRDGDMVRIISFRHASEEEREVYYDWLENDYEDD